MGRKIIGVAGKVAGPKGSWRRRWAVLLSSVATVAVSMLLIQNLLAVHATGAFQLDGDAASNTDPTPFNGQDDWDNVCYEVAVRPTNQGGGGLSAAAATAKCFKYLTPPAVGAPTSGASATAWTAEPLASSSIFTGGGSKDPDNISSWRWKDEANNPPDKDNLIHAYAARYSLNVSTECPNGLDPMDPDYLTTPCEVLYFGSDRFDNSGDAQQAFWFLQNKVETTTQKDGGGLKFSGVHRIGDVLVISDFSNGGTTSTITVLSWDPPRVNPDFDPMEPDSTEWIGCRATNKEAINAKQEQDDTTCVDANLRLLANLAGAAAKCTSADQNDAACGIVNPGLITMPWTFADKTPTPNDGAINGEFYEAGLNLSTLGLGDECFSSVVAETRSSTSTTATLKDFVVGQLGSCETTLTTTAALNAAGTAISGANSSTNGTAGSGTDTATLQIKGVQTWAGILEFYICGPIASGVCDVNGVKVGSDVTVNNTLGTSYQSGFVTLTSAGRYCWFAKFTPDAATLAKGVTGASHDGTPAGPDGNLECFIVRPAVPTLATAVTATPVTFGSATTDVATLTGLAKEPGTNGAATHGKAAYPTISATDGAFVGTIAYRLKGPDTVGPPAVCSTTDAVALSGSQPTAFPINTVVSGTGNAPTITPTSVSFTPNAPGKYHWVATFSGSGTGGTSVNNVASLGPPVLNLPIAHNADCSNVSEDVVVQQIPTTITSGPWTYPNDTATISSNNAAQNLPAGGTLEFKLFGQVGGTSALDACNAGAAFSTPGTGGLRYIQSFTGVGGAPSAARSTTNAASAGGLPAGGFQINSTNFGTYYWRVTYAPPANSTHTGKVSQCVEYMAVTGSDDPPPAP